MTCTYNVDMNPDNPPRPCGRAATMNVWHIGQQEGEPPTSVLCQRHFDMVHRELERNGWLDKHHWEEIT